MHSLYISKSRYCASDTADTFTEMSCMRGFYDSWIVIQKLLNTV